MYTVQVLLSTYNGEAYLKEQLDSILNQKNIAVKLFVRDDGSSDGTVDILRAYAALHDNMQYLSGENCAMFSINAFRKSGTSSLPAVCIDSGSRFSASSVFQASQQ